MVIFKNIDDLFTKPHMSSTNAGGQIQMFRLTWTKLNSGLLVLDPNKELFEDMLSKIGKLDVKDIGDQAFIHAYYPEWPRTRELHLSHVYNVFSCHLHLYEEEHGYILPEDIIPKSMKVNDDKYIRIIHYIGNDKPWMNMEKINYPPSYNLSHEQYANKLWLRAFKDFYKNIGKDLTDTEKRYIVTEGLKERKN